VLLEVNGFDFMAFFVAAPRVARICTPPATHRPGSIGACFAPLQCHLHSGAQMKAHYLIAIAESDDQREPQAKGVLRDSFAKALIADHGVVAAE
jgi:hypothetical protein